MANLAMPSQKTNGAVPRFFASEFFVSHMLVDTDYCRLLVLPAIEAVVSRPFNQYVFMNLQNFGKSSLADGKNAALFADEMMILSRNPVDQNYLIRPRGNVNRLDLPIYRRPMR
jgi:hypothetical protein